MFRITAKIKRVWVKLVSLARGRGDQYMTYKIVLVAAVQAGATFVVISAAPHAYAVPTYSDCGEANAAGEYAIPKTDPAYRAKLDWDGDGYACEAVEKKPAQADFN